jgi:hypothetical protein
MASAWLRLAAERTVHGSDQKIHVVGRGGGGCTLRREIATGRPSAVGVSLLRNRITLRLDTD